MQSDPDNQAFPAIVHTTYNNLVKEYPHLTAVTDGVNVGYDV